MHQTGSYLKNKNNAIISMITYDRQIQNCKLLYYNGYITLADSENPEKNSGKIIT